VLLATRARKWWAKLVSLALVAAWSVPTFWVAVILLMLFAGPRYLDWFPVQGLADGPEGGAEVLLGDQLGAGPDQGQGDEQGADQQVAEGEGEGEQDLGGQQPDGPVGEGEPGDRAQDRVDRHQVEDDLGPEGKAAPRHG
jgi:hypothetical protein